MKAIALPVNMLVIIAVAVIVLLGIVALYMMGTAGPFGIISYSAAKNEACSDLINKGCGVTDPASIYVNYDLDNSGTIDTSDTLQLLCNNEDCTVYSSGGDQIVCCKAKCGCPGFAMP